MGLPTAVYQLNGDLRAKLQLINQCLTKKGVVLSAGQLRALASLVFQQGSPLLGKTCHSQFTKDLINAKRDVTKVLVAEIKAKHGTKGRGAYEIWDATNGTDGEKRPANWTVATEVATQQGSGEKIKEGADGQIKIKPTDAQDGAEALTGVTPSKSYDCASVSDPEQRCGPFYIDEHVEITAAPTKPGWQFVRWESLSDGTGDTRDLCAKPTQQGATCTVNIQDQLVRAIAVFKKNPGCPVPGANGNAAGASPSRALLSGTHSMSAPNTSNETCGFEMTYSSGSGPGSGYSETYSETPVQGGVTEQENGNFIWDQTVSYTYAPAADGEFTLTQSFTYSASGSSQDTQGGNVISSCSIMIPPGTGYTTGGPDSLPVAFPTSLTFPWDLSEPPVQNTSTTSGCTGQAGFEASYGLPYPGDPEMNGLFSDSDTQAFSNVLAGSITVPLSQLPCQMPMNFVDQKTDYSTPSTPGLSQTIDLEFHGTLSIAAIGDTSTENRHDAARSEAAC